MNIMSTKTKNKNSESCITNKSCIADQKYKDQEHKEIKVKEIVNVKKEYLIKMGYMDFSDWVSHNDHVYIGRNMSFYVPGANGSIWQNPYPLCTPGKKYKDKKQRYTIDESLVLYEKYVRSRPDLMSKLHELDGKTLGCWCITSTNKKCHGTVLSKLVSNYCN